MADNLIDNKIVASNECDGGSELNFISFFHSSPDLLFVFDRDGLILEANRTASEKLQYRAEELKGKSIFLLHPPEYHKNGEKFLNEILKGSGNILPLPFVTKSGGLIQVETTITHGRWNGRDAVFSRSRDVTEKQRAELAARKIEERYRILFANINDAVFVHEFTADGMPGKFLEVNDIACERLGYTRDELLTMNPMDIDAPECRAIIPGIMKKLTKEKHIVREGIHVSQSGVRIPVEISNHLFEMEGRPVILATVRDITERKKSEILLKQSEEKYRKIFENVQDIFYQADINGRIVEISPSIERYSGYKPEELIGMKIEDVYLNPADRGELLKVLSIKGEIQDYIIKLRTKDKREVFVSANIHLLYGSEGVPIGVEGSLRDVTERIIAQERLKISEKMLREQNEEYSSLNEILHIKNEQILTINKELQQASDIFMSIRTGLYIYHLENTDDDRTLRMIAANPASERLTGIPVKDVIGRTLDENFPDLREKGIPGEFASVIRTRTSKHFEEVTHSNNKIGERSYSYNAFPLPDDCVGVSFESISEQIKAREVIIESNRQLMIAKEKAEESDRLKSAFLANMSHEIRTPMNGIMGFSIMLANPSLSKEERDGYVKFVSSSCDQLLHIVNDIIDISKIEAGQIELSESSFDLKELFNELYSFYSPAGREKGIEVIIDQLPDDLVKNSFIISDRTKLRQVLDNLLSNAVKFTQSGKIILRCKISGDKIRIEVEDTGIGIHPELQHAVFERFRQVETSYIKNYGGTGLGLSITKAYVEKMGGKIRISSELGKGSVFTFVLPYKPALREEKPEVHASKSQSLKEDLTVLVVEDEEINWYYLYEILKGTVKTLRAENGKLAMENIKRHPEIDLVLMDIKLPDINGLDLTRMIKAINSKIIIIAQTAFALTGDREKAIEAGCSDYITKPVNRDELLRLIAVHSSK